MPTKTKKAPAKKVSAKKKAPVKAKKSTIKKPTSMLAVMVHEHEHEDDHDHDALNTPVEKIIHRFEKRFVFVPSCSNCDHVPMRINRLVALMTVLVAVLSGMVIAQSQSIDLTQLLLALAHT